LTLLGVLIFGNNAPEMVHIGQAVMGWEGTVDYLVDAVFNYPTFSEVYRVAALDVGKKIRALKSVPQLAQGCAAPEPKPGGQA
jgi:NAD(P) transhydrogenase